MYDTMRAHLRFETDEGTLFEFRNVPSTRQKLLDLQASQTPVSFIWRGSHVYPRGYEWAKMRKPLWTVTKIIESNDYITAYVDIYLE